MGLPAGMGVRPQRGPGSQRVLPACCRQRSDLRRWLVGLPGLEPGTSSLSGICAWPCFPRIVSATWANDAPLETAANRSAPMGCGPNVDQARPARGAAALRVADLGWQGRPPPAAPTSEPRRGERLVRGSPGGVWARDIPCIDGLSLVTAMGYPSLLPVQTIRTTAASWLRTPPGRPPSRSTAGRTVRWAWHDRSEASGRAGALPAAPALAPLPLLIPVVSPLIVAVWVQVQPAVRALLQQLLERLAAGKPE